LVIIDNYNVLYTLVCVTYVSGIVFTSQQTLHSLLHALPPLVITEPTFLHTVY